VANCVPWRAALPTILIPCGRQTQNDNNNELVTLVAAAISVIQRDRRPGRRSVICTRWEVAQKPPPIRRAIQLRGWQEMPNVDRVYPRRPHCPRLLVPCQYTCIAYKSHISNYLNQVTTTVTIEFRYAKPHSQFTSFWGWSWQPITWVLLTKNIQHRKLQTQYIIQINKINKIPNMWNEWTKQVTFEWPRSNSSYDTWPGNEAGFVYSFLFPPRMHMRLRHLWIIFSNQQENNMSKSVPDILLCELWHGWEPDKVVQCSIGQETASVRSRTHLW